MTKQEAMTELRTTVSKGTPPPLARTPRVLGMENRFTGVRRNEREVH